MRSLALPKEVEHWSLTRLRERPVKIGAKLKMTEEVRPNGGKSGQMALLPRADLQNQAIGWLRKECCSLGGGTVVKYPRP